jgi:phage terminase small subunit
MLTPRRERFAQEVASGKHATDAYRAAFSTSNMSNASIWSNASIIYKNDKVVSRIKELRAIAADVVLVDIQMILRDCVDVLTADTSELITYRRLNCRHCHGLGHAFRWRDDEEFWNALAVASDKQERARPTDPPVKLPTDEGGYGFRRLAPPAPDCPACEGEGLEEARIADIRTLSGPARRLYAGVKQTKDGIQVLMRDKDAARALLAKYLGMTPDKVQHGGVVGITPVAPAELSPKQRAAMMKAIEHDI